MLLPFERTTVRRIRAKGFRFRDGDFVAPEGAPAPILKAEYFDAFVAGTKRDELRRYGPRWNERTCRVGREVVLSRGYGKDHRLCARIERFKRQRGAIFGSTYKASIQRVFGTLNLDIACISLTICTGDACLKYGDCCHPDSCPMKNAKDEESA